MSTSYYWSGVPTFVEFTTPIGTKVSIHVDRDCHELHIGKYVQSRAPDGTIGVFLWAHPKEQIVQFCKGNSDKTVIENEYGEKFTCADFLKEVDGVYGDESRVGEDFC